MSLADKPAFPCSNIQLDIDGERLAKFEDPGMTLREFYAGLIMLGHCANSNMAGDSIDFITRISIEQANALIDELEKSKTGE